MPKQPTKNVLDSRKREPLVSCSKCNKKVDPKNTIVCILCKNNFEYDCIGYSEKLHRLKDVATRKTWRCKLCEKKHKTHSTPINSASPVASTSNKSFQPPDNKTPTSKDSCKEIPSKEQNSTAHKTETDWKCDYKVNVLTSNSFQSLSDDEMYDHIDHTLTSPISRLTSSWPDIRKFKVNLREKLEDLEIQNRLLQERLQTAEREIDNLHLENSELRKTLSKHENKAKYLVDVLNHSTSKKNVTLRNKRKCLKGAQLDFSIGEENKHYTQDYSNKQYNPSSNISKRNLTILSSNNRNKILNTTKHTGLYDTYNLCHHIIPGGGVKELLSCLESEVKKLDDKDFCVLLIGENDFKNNTSIQDIIYEIRVKVLAITTTNIIIALPTYICGAPIYNYKIENFNYMMLCDRELNKKSFIIDSNLNLTFDMFSKWSGKLNNLGVKQILLDISTQAQYINPIDDDQINLVPKAITGDFFRD